MLFKLRGTLFCLDWIHFECVCACNHVGFLFNLIWKKRSIPTILTEIFAERAQHHQQQQKPKTWKIFGNNSGISFKLAVYRDIYDLLLKCDYIALQWAAAIWAIYKHWKMAIKVINGLHLIYECILALSSQSVYGINRNILIVPFSFDPTPSNKITKIFAQLICILIRTTTKKAEGKK